MRSGYWAVERRKQEMKRPPMRVSGSIAMPRTRQEESLSIEEINTCLSSTLNWCHQIQEALGTSAIGDELVAVAKRARDAEIQLTILKNLLKEIMK